MIEEQADLKPFALFAEFTQDDREAVSELLEAKQVAKARRLFREGGVSEGLILVTSGSVELSSSRTEHKAIVGAGSAIGALSLMVVGPHELSARTLEPTELRLLPRESFRRLVDDYPRTACRLCEAIVSELAGDVREALDGFGDA